MRLSLHSASWGTVNRAATEKDPGEPNLCTELQNCIGLTIYSELFSSHPPFIREHS